jgi:hypothetical protein
MVRKISPIFGSAMAALCFVSTLAMAQPQTTTPDSSRNPESRASQTRSNDPAQEQAEQMTCIKDDGKGMCTAAVGADGKDMVVVGNGAKTGDIMMCVNRGSIVDCKPTS